MGVEARDFGGDLALETRHDGQCRQHNGYGEGHCGHGNFDRRSTPASTASRAALKRPATGRYAARQI